MDRMAKHAGGDAAARLGALKAVAAGRGRLVEPALLSRLARQDLVMRAESGIALSQAGKAALRRALSEIDPFQEQHRDMAAGIAETPSGRAAVRINMAESPLAQLSRRKGRDGQPFLGEAEWRAGERLRLDYTRGQIMPRLGANWDAAISTGRRTGAGADLTDGALAARARVEKALDAVGPELSGVLVDVCCFLKGLETVEAERGWPVRSAKIVLKSALGVLSRHYDPRAAAPRRRPIVLNWGAADYRPAIDG